MCIVAILLGGAAVTGRVGGCVDVHTGAADVEGRDRGSCCCGGGGDLFGLSVAAGAAL